MLEAIEAITNAFFGMQVRVPLRAIHCGPDKIWGYETFKEYLAAIGRGKLFLPPKTDYPLRIRLSQEWHEVLDKMRTESQDGIERHRIIGANGSQRGLYLSAISSRGRVGYVPAEVIINSIERARDAGINALGDLHSHPKVLNKRRFGELHRLFRLFKAGLSAGDLYCMLRKESYMPVMGVVEGEENVFAFRTRETSVLEGISAYLTQDAFEKYWYEQHGFLYLGKIEALGGFRAIPITSTADSRRVQMGIAERHNLVLYRGYMGKDLVRLNE
ncbi:hypothetical protein HYS91_03790 [Candidatus Daviesbacteria bacterium]|nr:hypothetical protein [Candidatus Daviesbacteria bacterium]